MSIRSVSKSESDSSEIQPVSNITTLSEKECADIAKALAKLMKQSPNIKQRFINDHAEPFAEIARHISASIFGRADQTTKTTPAKDSDINSVVFTTFYSDAVKTALKVCQTKSYNIANINLDLDTIASTLKQGDTAYIVNVWNQLTTSSDALELLLWARTCQKAIIAYMFAVSRRINTETDKDIREQFYRDVYALFNVKRQQFEKYMKLGTAVFRFPILMWAKLTLTKWTSYATRFLKQIKASPEDTAFWAGQDNNTRHAVVTFTMSDPVVVETTESVLNIEEDGKMSGVDEQLLKMDLCGLSLKKGEVSAEEDYIAQLDKQKDDEAEQKAREAVGPNWLKTRDDDEAEEDDDESVGNIADQLDAVHIKQEQDDDQDLAEGLEEEEDEELVPE